MNDLNRKEYEALKQEIDFKNKLYYWLFPGKSWVKPAMPAMPADAGRIRKHLTADRKGLLIFLIIIVIFGIFIRVSVNTDTWENSRYTPAQEQALDNGN